MSAPDKRERALAVDNDILIKAACYIASSALWPEPDPGDSIGVLGQARFVVTDRISRMTLNGPAAEVATELGAILDRATVLEPDEQEVVIAAEVEARAAEGRYQLDAGESQLAAIVTKRGMDLLQTGDKRAIRALEAILDSVPALSGLFGRVMCLEQLFREALERGAMSALRLSVCREDVVDIALTMCFACHSPDPSAEDVLTGLSSYIEDVRRDAPRLLVS